MTEEMTLEEYWKEVNNASGPTAKKKRSPKKADANQPNEADLRPLMEAAGIPSAFREYKFHPVRRWKFDYAWPEYKLYLEIDGGTFGRPVVCNHCHQPVKRMVNGRSVPVREGGRHNTGTGFEGDCDKLNEASALGWRGVRVTTAMVQDGRMLLALLKIFNAEV